tara:strand:- start:1787 stop:1966 length:180 start_codon:yes stop_codon:yes gene_type:complete
MENRNNKSALKNLLEEIWEEIEIQLFAILSALIFFSLIFLFFKPNWMSPVKNILENLSL